MWSFMEAKRAVYTSILMKEIQDCGHIQLTDRALRQQRASYRRGETKCQSYAECLKARLKAARRTP